MYVYIYIYTHTYTVYVCVRAHLRVSGAIQCASLLADCPEVKVTKRLYALEHQLPIYKSVCVCVCARASVHG
jgi:hypothetical protein